jgi:putative resolvase
MKLSDWAKKQGINYLTAYRWFKAGHLKNAQQYPTGTIMIDDEPKAHQSENQCYIYCRVSNHSRKKELNYQVDRCLSFAKTRGYEVVKVFKEIASGMNDNRKELNKLLDLNPAIIIVEHKDRLTRFGFNYLDKLLPKIGTQLVVINRDKTDETDLMKDLVSIISSFCCRLYGLRRGKATAKKVKEYLNE